ncbi:MAG: chaperone NapD [Gammaproteobacteria bacterium]|nr:chaperone NapD [Gammaproteobacteria bacterium]
MNIAGVLVNALPGKKQEVEIALLDMPGVEVHIVNEQGRMVVTIEGADERMVSDTLSQMHALNGVLSAAMVYHSFDDSETEGGSP